MTTPGRGIAHAEAEEGVHPELEMNLRWRGAAGRLERYRLQGGVYALLVAEVTRREVGRIELVFAAAGEVRTMADAAAASGEVRSSLVCDR